MEDCKQIEEVEINGNQRIHYGSFQGKSSIRKIIIDGKDILLNEDEQLYSLQRYNQKVAIVVQDKDGLFKTRAINIENNKEVTVNGNFYLCNDGSFVGAINSIADISLERLKKLKENGNKKLYICGATRDLKQPEIEKGVEYDLYNIDDLIQIKTMIQEIKNEIIVPAKEDKHRQKKIYAQIVRMLSEKMEYDFYGAYIEDNKSEDEKETVKFGLK